MLSRKKGELPVGTMVAIILAVALFIFLMYMIMEGGASYFRPEVVLK